MTSRHIWASVALLLAALGWAVALVIDPAPWIESTAAVLGAGLMVTCAVAVTAVLIEHSRFGYWLGIFGLGLMVAIASFRSIDPTWVAAIVVMTIAGVLFADPRLGGWIRMEGAVAPVPGQAAALGMLFLIAPTLTALSLVNRSGVAVGWLGLASWAILVLYVRRLPGAVAAVRLGAPALIGAAALVDMPGAALWGTMMLAASLLAWSKSVRLAIRPLVERGSRVSIPPELLSNDLRKAAGIERDQR